MRTSMRIAFVATAGLIVLLAGTAPAFAHSGDRNHNKIPDKWEKKYHLSTTRNQAKQDPDRDGLNNYYEYLAGTNPKLKDTDRDHIWDGLEDKDRDGLVNLAEIKSRTDIRYKDTDKDGLIDSLEDPDEDLLNNAQEWKCGTNPWLADTDDNGLIDSDEDFDDDGLTNAQEFACETDPLIADTNDNGVVDCDEDADEDALTNAQEFECETDPLLADTDGDGTFDCDEDFDGDGLVNHSEYEEGCDPSNPDSDGDGVEDGDEIRGTVVSIDADTGAITVVSLREGGATYEFIVNDATSLSWAEVGDDAAPPAYDPTLDDLFMGSEVSDVNAVEQPDGSMLVVSMALLPPDADDPGSDIIEPAFEVVSFDPDTGTLTLLDLFDGVTEFDLYVDVSTAFIWADETYAGPAAGMADLTAGAGVYSYIDGEPDPDTGAPFTEELVLVPPTTP
jgi:hypothetical protein